MVAPILAANALGGQPDAATRCAGTGFTVALLAVVCVVVLVPLMAVALPPLHDYPFHLARADAIAALAGQMTHATHYRIGSFLLPNVAMDVVTLGLTGFLAPMLAGRVFLGIVLLLMLGGTVALHRVLHGRFSPWPLLAGFFLYNWIFLFGFTNYLFGVGMMLWSVAAWLALHDAPVLARLVVGTMLGVVVLLCHLVAFGLFAVILGGLGLAEILAGWRATRRLALAGAMVHAVPVCIALALFLALSPTAGEVHQPISYSWWIGWKTTIAARTVLSSIPWLDVATLGPMAALIALAAWRRRLRLAGAMLPPIVLLGLTFLVMPDTLFGSHYADVRLPVAMLLVVIAALDPVRQSRQALIAGAGLALGLLIFRSAVITADWREAAPLFSEYETAFDLLPAGSTLYVATTEPYPSLAYRSAAELARWHPPLKHVASLASVGRDVFVPSTWADPYKQPIAVLPRHAAAKRLQGDNPFQTQSGDTLEAAMAGVRALRPASAATEGAASEDFLLLLRPEGLRGALPPGLAATTRGGSFAMFRIE